MKKMYILFLIIFGFEGAIAQNNNIITNYEPSQYKFAGHCDSIPIYQCNYRYDEPIKDAVNFALYWSNIKQDGKISFNYFKPFKKEHFIYYLKDNLLVYRKAKGKEIFIGELNGKNEYHVNKIGEFDMYKPTHCLTQSDFFYFSTKINNIKYLARIDITEKDPKMEVLPIKGSDPILLDNWLYYKIAYETSNHAIGSVASIYRVEVGDWRNPELLMNNVEFWGAVINKKLLGFKVYHRNEWRKVIYNISDSTYIEKSISSLIKYKGKKYQETLCKNEETGKMQYCYEDIPDLPGKFPHKLEKDIESNHNFLHLPHTQKPFEETFITDSLLFFAGKEELLKLSKPQLRKLRNAFYAREGYDFNSRDLKEFFSQYEWYINTLERRKAFDLTNDDIYMPPANMERIRLIQSVEKSK